MKQAVIKGCRNKRKYLPWQCEVTHLRYAPSGETRRSCQSDMLESEPDEKILNHTGVMENSRVCFDRLLMRAAVVAEGDYSERRKGCWKGNQHEPGLRQPEEQGLKGKRCFTSSLKGHRIPILNGPQVKSACCGTLRVDITSTVSTHRKWKEEISVWRR